MEKALRFDSDKKRTRPSDNIASALLSVSDCCRVERYSDLAVQVPLHVE